MRIGIDARAAAEVPAGRGRYVREVVRHLAQLEPPHELILYGRSRWERAEIDGRVRWRLVGSPDPLWTVHAAICVNRECDVFLATNTYLMAGLLRIPTVAVVHDLAAFDRQLRTPRGSFAERATLRIAVRRARALIAVSEATRETLVARFRSAAARTEVIPHAADARFASPEVCDEVLERYGLTHPYVLAVGTLEPRKNLPRLAEAFAALPDELRAQYQLAIAGKLGWNTRETESSLEKLGSQVRRLDYVPDDDLPCIYRGAELFCYPSLYEGFGLPVLEAMSAGTAVLTSNVSSLPEVGGDAAAYADPFDTDAIRSQLEQLLTDPERRARLAEDGRERARAFTWRRTAERTLETLEHAARS